MRSPITFYIIHDMKCHALIAGADQLALKSIQIHADYLRGSNIIYNDIVTRWLHVILTECPTCKLAMESHSTDELMECCMKQVGTEFSEEDLGTCPNCKHDLKKHSRKELAECTLAFLKSGINYQYKKD